MNKDAKKRHPELTSFAKKPLFAGGERGPTSPALFSDTAPYSHRLLKFTLNRLTHGSANFPNKIWLFGGALQVLLMNSQIKGETDCLLINPLEPRSGFYQDSCSISWLFGGLIVF